MFFVIQRTDWKDIAAPKNIPDTCYDEYGMSLIAILVDVASNKLLNSTSRWNHIVLPTSGAADTLFENWQQLNTIVGMNIESICKNECKVIKDRHEKLITNTNKEVEKILTGIKIITHEVIPTECRDYLTEVNIPNSVKKIGSFAFQDCQKLTSVSIPDSVNHIASYAFRFCRNLTSINIPNSIKIIEDDAFSECNSLTSINIPDSIKILKEKTFCYCESLTSINIPDSVKIIEDDVFTGCKNLISINIPDSVKSIGTTAFYGCENLTSIKIPNSIKNIGAGAFAKCQKLTS
ncbi:MAG: leucine-rich repeat domain-containing protein, partial [Methanobrevibacter sp.]|nr:leucine-rich repeat domain-containing protein [Methanobrevibacter sp.]